MKSARHGGIMRAIKQEKKPISVPCPITHAGSFNP